MSNLNKTKNKNVEFVNFGHLLEKGELGI